MNKFVLSVFAIFLFGALIVTAFVFYGSDQKIPDGETGPGAENLRNEIEKSVNMDDWNSMAALEFSVTVNQNHHFLDRKRGLVEVRFKQDDDDFLVQYDSAGNALAYMNQEKLTGSKLKNSYGIAKAIHETDIFWLNPVAFFRDASEIKKIGNRALLVTFKNINEGGYLVVTDNDKRPTHWKMWSDRVPVKGIETSFDNWQKIKNRNSWISLEHKNDFQKIIFTDVIGYDAYPPAGTKDRFLNFKSGASRIIGD